MAQHDLPYDYEDFGMDAAELEAKYGSDNGGHPEYPIAQWRDGPNEEHDSNGYWDWVAHMVEADDNAIPSNS